MQVSSTVFVIILLFQKATSGDYRLLVHAVVTTFPHNIWPCTMGGKSLYSSLFCRYSFEIFTSVFASLLSGALFSWSCAGFQVFPSPCVDLSVPSGIVGVGVLSGLIAVWCLIERRGLIREEVRENIVSPLSSLTVSPIFCLSSPPLPLFLPSLSDSLHDYTEWWQSCMAH